MEMGNGKSLLRQALRQLRAPVKHLNDGSRRGATTLVYNFYRKQSQTLKQPLALCLISMVFMLP